ncbi:MFS transporter [Rhodoplanes sp. TEM]|uniref:MFS transporter n=1 Tax=Rhodoplanes tepidamans TaxID=200616 RepID=A0ABT5J7N3_RHOTP|nr:MULTISPECIES: MFS transporter [Rhodoplanes]MDC7785639.1 MFS transporter [Rhodoplanes tepidamans]MDC7983280.1 MFS transporter [Rhodoplanes sp. TEM]MDQ0354795.1 MHS family shikimate/dehydroshikimate transporter-like MFS transporter [Rhodoplanes tepidamans]
MSVADQAATDQLVIPAPETSSDMRRIVWSSVIGTAVEWYDFLIYAVATALVFNKLFFPATDPGIATIAAFGTYGVGFLARPLGAAVFGHFGDQVGRKAMLAITIIIMGLGTFAIGLLPTYEQIGVAAPALLVMLRFVQGIGLGGEWGGAVLMAVENAPAHRRGLYGSLVQVGNPVGNLAALAIFAVVSQLPESEFMAWGWRIPFLLSILLIGVGLFIRLRLEETPAFRAVQAKSDVSRRPVTEVLTRHRKAFLTAVGLKIAEISYASIAGVFVISYATQTLGMPRATVLNGVMASSFIALFTIPLFGWLSDIVGRKAMFYASCLFCMGFAFPMFALLDTRDPLIVTLTVVVAISFGQMVMFGIGAPFYSELFAARLRYSGASLGFQIGAALSGGLTPFVAAALMAWSGGQTWPISLYLIACGLITTVATFAAPETARKELT